MKTVLIVIAGLMLVLPVQARYLYITRHGQSGFREYYDHAVKEYTLTPLGREQASLLGKYLKDVCRFKGTVLVSPILRTVETGVIVAAELDCKVILEPGIQEVNTGNDRRCMTLQEIEERFPDKTAAGKNFVHPWRVVNENKTVWQQRYVREMDKILKENPGDLLLITHAGGVGSIVPELCLRGDFPRLSGVFNCALFIFELDENDRPVSGKNVHSFMPREKITDNRRYLEPRK